MNSRSQRLRPSTARGAQRVAGALRIPKRTPSHPVQSPDTEIIRQQVREDEAAGHGLYGGDKRSRQQGRQRLEEASLQADGRRSSGLKRASEPSCLNPVSTWSEGTRCVQPRLAQTSQLSSCLSLSSAMNAHLRPGLADLQHVFLTSCSPGKDTDRSNLENSVICSCGFLWNLQSFPLGQNFGSSVYKTISLCSQNQRVLFILRF